MSQNTQRKFGGCMTTQFRDMTIFVTVVNSSDQQYRIGIVSKKYRILFFEYRGKYRKNFKVSVLYREKNQKFNPFPIRLDQ